jgi:hypothetical protein
VPSISPDLIQEFRRCGVEAVRRNLPPNFIGLSVCDGWQPERRTMDAAKYRRNLRDAHDAEKIRKGKERSRAAWASNANGGARG